MGRKKENCFMYWSLVCYPIYVAAAQKHSGSTHSDSTSQYILHPSFRNNWYQSLGGQNTKQHSVFRLSVHLVRLVKAIPKRYNMPLFGVGVI